MGEHCTVPFAREGDGCHREWKETGNGGADGERGGFRSLVEAQLGRGPSVQGVGIHIPELCSELGGHLD